MFTLYKLFYTFKIMFIPCKLQFDLLNTQIKFLKPFIHKSIQ